VAVDRRDLRRRLFALAASQGCYFTAAQAKAIGYSYQAQAHHVAAGNWDRVGRGTFRLAECIPEQHDDLVRWGLWSKGQGTISHESALAVHGIGEFESPRVHLTVPAGYARRDASVILHFASLPPCDVEWRTGFRVTNVARSLIDVAASEADETQLARAIRESVQAGHLTVRSLRARAEAVDLKGALWVERAIARAAETQPL
jgi:predicted transcriptional regulator of viral defense system